MILEKSFQLEESFEMENNNVNTDEITADVLELMIQLQRILPNKTDSKLDIIESAIHYIAELNAMLGFVN